MEDFVTWTHTSAIRKHVMEYNEMVTCLILLKIFCLKPYYYC